MALSELVEGLVSQNGQGLFSVRYGEDDDRAFPFSRRGAIAALDVDTGLRQEICHFVERAGLIFKAENECGLFRKFDLSRFQRGAGAFKIGH